MSTDAKARAVRAHKLYIFDRHTQLVWFADLLHGPTASPAAEGVLPGVAPIPRDPVPVDGRLPLSEESKLVYGVVYSLRNLARTLAANQAATLDSYTTPSYSLTHFQAPTGHTFVLLTDPLPATHPQPRDSSSTPGFVARWTATALPEEKTTPPNLLPGGESVKSVLHDLWAGPWRTFVALNPGGHILLDHTGPPPDGHAEALPGVSDPFYTRSRGVDSDPFRDAVYRCTFASSLPHTCPRARPHARTHARARQRPLS